MTNRPCPRCGLALSRYPALSRWDNATSICSACGGDEAMAQFAGLSIHPISGVVRWYAPPKDTP